MIDQKLLIIVGLLVATVAAYLAGLTPYPIGWFVLSILLAMRIGQLWRERGQRKGKFQA